MEGNAARNYHARVEPASRGGERRPVTTLFADVVGSTGLAETMDPEEWAELVNGAFHVLSEPVARYEGTVAQLQGDAMLAIFGAPFTHEDDPERAVRAAIDMVHGMEAYGRNVGVRHGVPLQVRIGLNTGPVVVGHVGSDQRLEYTAIGDTMNVAARMQTSADPGTIRITEATTRLVAHAIETRDLGEVEVKGKSARVHAFEVVGARAVRASPRGLPGMSSPLVGRERELGVLRDALGDTVAGSGSAAVVLGEPGIGKTRLLREFRDLVEEDGMARWVEAQGISHGRTLPFHLVIGLVERLASLPDGDPTARRAALERAVGNADRGAPSGDGSMADHLAYLLSLPVDAQIALALERMEPERLRRRYAKALGSLLERVAGDAPLVIAIEDLHWADGSSVSTLTDLLPALAGARALLILTSRSDPGSAAKPLLDAVGETFGAGAHSVSVAPLSEGESRSLVAHLLEIESLPDDARTTILSKAEGNPFFVEEVVRMLIDRGVVMRRGERWVAHEGVGTVEIPPTVQGLLLARIDALPERPRSVLRAASVIGRTFGSTVLDEVAGPLDGTLAALEAVGLVVPDLDAGAERFTFRHALVQETAYESILRRDRAELHRAVAEAIQRVEPDRSDELAAELAMHYGAAGDHVEAAEWAFRAARDAERRSAMPEARELYDRAAEWLPDDPANAGRRIEIALGQGRSGLYFKSFDAEAERLALAATWSEELGDSRLIVEVDAALAFALQIRGDQYDTSETLRRAVDRAVEVGETLGDDPIRGRPLLARGGARLMAGAYEEAAADLAIAVPLLEGTGDLLWAFEAQNNLAWAYTRLGRRADAEAAVEHAVDLANRSGSPTAKVDVKSTVAINFQEREDFDSALRLAREAATEGEEKRVLTCAAFGHLTAGEILLQRGDTEEAERSLNRATRLARITKAAFIENLGKAGLNAARWAEGRREEALAGWSEALDRSVAEGDPYAAADVRWRRGSALAGEAATREAGIADLEAAVKGFEALNARPAQARALRDLAAGLAAAGRANEAERAADAASELRREVGLDAS